MLDYFDYDKIKNSKDGDIKIKCYYTGVKWLCPNPQNEKLCYQIYEWYQSTHNVILKEVLITKELLELIKKS